MTRPHRDRVRVHQAAGGVLGVGEHGFDPCTVAGIERREHLIGNGRRQLLEDVGEIVRVEVFGDGGHLGGLHVFEELSPDVVVKLLQHLVRLLLVEQLPKHLAHVQRRGFEQVGELRRSEGRQEEAGLIDAAAVVQAHRIADLFLHVFPERCCRKRVLARFAGGVQGIRTRWISRRASAAD